MRVNYTIYRGMSYGFREKDFERLDDLVKQYDSMQAQIGSKVVEEVRSSRITWLSSNVWLKERLWRFAEEANRKNYGFDVTRACDVQYTEYLAEQKGHYDWHVDVHPQREGMVFDRKLSLTVQLTDPDEYEGGKFEIERQTLPDWHTEKGTVLVFPSYIKHKVNPVTKGTRRSLVAWFEGPIWR